MRTSLALSTYNGSRFIIDLLDSIKNQTEKINEVVICDDCSTDNTVQLIKNYIAKYNLEHWILLINDINIGWRSNFRKAMDKCQNELIFLCDQDDIWMDDKVEKMHLIMENNNNIELLVSNYEPFFENKNKTGETYQIKGLNNNSGNVKKIEFKNFHCWCMRPGCTFCFRKKLYLATRVDDDESIPHDDTLWSLASVNNSLYLYEKILIRYRRHGDNATAEDSKRDIDTRIKVLEECIKVTEWTLEKVKKYNFQGAEFEECQSFLLHLRRRLNMMKRHSVFGGILFAMKELSYYPTIRNAMSDIYYLFQK